MPKHLVNARNPTQPTNPRGARPRNLLAAIRHDLHNLPATTTPAVRAVVRRYVKALATEPPEIILAVCNSMLTTRRWPERFMAAELLAGRPDAFRRVKSAAIERWAKGLADWGSIDMYGVLVAGVAWREGLVPDRQVMAWARSPDRWQRRLALVATVPLNSRARGGSGDTARTLKVCRALVDDRDDMVVKALSWALRELAKRDPGSVARFVRGEGDRLASRVRREVLAKLETGRKVRPRDSRAGPRQPVRPGPAARSRTRSSERQ